MTRPQSPALQTALAYYHAWTGNDIDTAMSYIADDIVCDAPAGRLAGMAAFRPFMAGFAPMLTGTTLLAAFGDDDTALLLYDTETIFAKSFPAAEYVTVKNGKITAMRIVFDQTPFATFRAGSPGAA